MTQVENQRTGGCKTLALNRTVLIKKLIVWVLVVASVFALHDNPPRKTQAEINNVQTVVNQEAPKEVVKPTEIKQQPTVAPQPKQEVVKPQPVPQPKPVATQVQYGSGCTWLSSVLQQHGITGADLTAALNIATKESGCRQAAVNSSSGSCNVFQELPCGKWGGVNDLAGHIRGANAYAKARYGGWQGAWSAWQGKHWW